MTYSFNHFIIDRRRRSDASSDGCLFELFGAREVRVHAVIMFRVVAAVRRDTIVHQVGQLEPPRRLLILRWVGSNFDVEAAWRLRHSDDRRGGRRRRKKLFNFMRAGTTDAKVSRAVADVMARLAYHLDIAADVQMVGEVRHKFDVRCEHSRCVDNDCRLRDKTNSVTKTPSISLICTDSFETVVTLFPTFVYLRTKKVGF